MITQTLQSPPIYSSTYNPIVWMIESNQTQNYNFKFVFDVYVGGATGPIRFKTPANPAGRGLIDVNSISQIQMLITGNLPSLSDTPFYGGTGLAGEVYILAGEEYSVTLNGDIIMYNGLTGTAGEPAYGLYADANFRPCPNATTPVVAMAWGQSANTYYDYIAAGGETVLDYEMALTSQANVGGKWLTRYPGLTQEIRSDEDFTISWLNYNFETAPGPSSVPYAMVVKGYYQGLPVGEQVFYNTEANGGDWTSCSTYPGGPTGSQRYVSSFKINPMDLTFTGSGVRTRTDIFGPTWNWSYYTPFPQCFPDTFTPVGTSLGWTVYNSGTDNFLSIGATGTTGSSNILSRSMTVATGSELDIIIQSPNFYFGDYGDLELWGLNGTWQYVDTFSTQEVFGGTTNYILVNFTTTAPYTALGLRYNRTTPKAENFLIGYNIGLWDITGPSGPQPFDQFCLALYPYDDYAACTVGPEPDSEVMCLTINDQNCWGFEPIRFTWLNNLAGRDWFTFIKRNTYTQNANRSTTYKLPGYWSAASYSTKDNSPARYGTTTFRVDLTNNWTASTNWLTEAESEFLRSMFASPSVLAYLPGRTQPTLITITDATYSVQTYPREKLFQYFVSFTESQLDVVQGF